MRSRTLAWPVLCLAAACLASSPAAERADERGDEEQVSGDAAQEASPSPPLLDPPSAPPATSPPVPPGRLLFDDELAGFEHAEANADAGAKQPSSVEISEPTTVLVVLDKSGSMASPWSGADSRWVAANKALIGALQPASAQLSVGAILFPLPGACDVAAIDQPGQYPFMPGGEFIAHWKQTIRRNGSEGSTPLERALVAADEAIAGAGALLDQRFMVLVVTDGEPTCQDDLALLESLPAQWHERGISTHVMGLPGSEAAVQLLDRIAKAGGSEKHTQIGTPDQLQSGIAVLLD